MQPIRKYNLVVNLKKNQEAKNIWKSIGEIAVWQNDDGSERLQTQLYMYPQLDIATFLQQPREPQNTHNNPTTPPQQPQKYQSTPTTPPFNTETSGGGDDVQIGDLPF